MKKAYIRPEATLIRIAASQILASSTNIQADGETETDMQCSMRYPEEDWDEKPIVHSLAATVINQPTTKQQ